MPTTLAAHHGLLQANGIIRVTLIFWFFGGGCLLAALLEIGLGAIGRPLPTPRSSLLQVGRFIGNIAIISLIFASYYWMFSFPPVTAEAVFIGSNLLSGVIFWFTPPFKTQEKSPVGSLTPEDVRVLGILLLMIGIFYTLLPVLTLVLNPTFS